MPTISLASSANSVRVPRKFCGSRRFARESGELIMTPNQLWSVMSMYQWPVLRGQRSSWDCAMHIEGQTLDDLLQAVFRRALKSKVVTRSSKGAARELMGVMLKLTNPRARFSRTERRATLLSCLGETLWYFSGSDAFGHRRALHPCLPRISRRDEAGNAGTWGLWATNFWQQGAVTD